MTFGQNLRFYRRKCGYTQAALAARLHVHRTTLSYYERDKTSPDAKRTLQMARLLGVEMESFFEGSAEERWCAR
jgi:transcriptional regulator with XRE-family HTH domain